MAAGQLLCHLHELHADQSQPSPFQPGDNFAGEPALNTVGLNQDKCTFQDDPPVRFRSGVGSNPFQSITALFSSDHLENQKRAAIDSPFEE